MARPKKFSTGELLSIVNKYLVENQYITKLKHSDLAKYSNELGYTEITYQDFCRNKEIKAFIDEYNRQKKMTMYSKNNSDKLEKLNFNVDDVVDKNIKEVKQLKIILKIFKNIYDSGFDRIIKYEDIIKEYENKLKEQEKAIKDLKEKNTLLRNKLSDSEKLYHSSRNNDKEKWIFLTIQYLIKESNITIKSEDQIIEILKNIGYAKNEELINEKDIIKSEFNNTDEDLQPQNIVESEKENEENIIPINKGHKLKIPDFMK